MDPAIKQEATELGRPATTKGNDSRAIAKSNAQQTVKNVSCQCLVYLQWLSEMCAKISSLGVFGEKQPNHVLINEYTPGQGIMVSPTYPALSVWNMLSFLLMHSHTKMVPSTIPLSPQSA